LPWANSTSAVQAFARYRRQGGPKRRPLHDLFIGAHAAVANLDVLTRDVAGYRS
jgi:predicted nucleic acid-binding protein